ITTCIDIWRQEGMDWEKWVAEVEQARAAFAALIGTVPANVAVGSSVSQLASSVASALISADSARSGRRRILSSVIEFPGVAHAWLAARAYGWQVDILEADASDTVSAEQFRAASGPETALLSIPHVVYTNGTLLHPAKFAEI